MMNYATPEYIAAAMSMSNALERERRRVFCTEASPWKGDSPYPVTHTGGNDVRKPWDGGPSGYTLVVCEFCGGTKDIVPPPSAEELKWERDRQLLARMAHPDHSNG